MKHTTLALSSLIFSFSISYGQTYKIHYESIDYGRNGSKTFINPTELYTNTRQSVFMENKIVDGRSTKIEEGAYRSGERLGIKASGDSLGMLLQKFFVNGMYKQRTLGRNYKKSTYVLIQDSILPAFNWQLSGDQKKVLGYTVQRATTTYKKRDITAWFTSAITSSDGPWKFGGLPGLILEVNIADQGKKDIDMTYKAVLIKTIAELPDVQIPIDTPSMTLEALEKRLIDVTEKRFKFYKSKSKSDGLKLRYDDLDFEPIIFSNH